MKFLDIKFIIIIILILAIICLSIYSFSKEITYNDINDLYIDNIENSSVDEQNIIVVHISGEVLNPGIVELQQGARIADAITAADNVTPLADLSKVNLAYQLKDGQKIYIPSIYDEDDISYIINDAGINVLIADKISSQINLININSASIVELQTLPGIGSSIAQEIINYRENNGNFNCIEDLMHVSGIGEVKFDNIKNFICI